MPKEPPAKIRIRARAKFWNSTRMSNADISKRLDVEISRAIERGACPTSLFEESNELALHFIRIDMRDRTKTCDRYAKIRGRKSTMIWINQLRMFRVCESLLVKQIKHNGELS